MKRILITGAAGFIGSHVANGLALEYPKSEIFTTVRDNPIKEYLEKMPLNISPIVCNLMNSNLVKILPKNIDIILHFAANSQSFISPLNANLQFFNNLQMTSSLVNYAITNNVKTFAFASSVYIYSGVASIPYKEEILSIPSEPLGASKIAIEALIKMKSLEGQFNSIAYRLFTVYGPGSRTTQFIPQAIEKLQNNDSVAHFGAGNIKRDFIYISDAVDAIITSLKNKQKFNPFQPLNVGTGIATSIDEVLKILAELIGTNKEILYTDLPLGIADVDHCASLKNIKKLIKWRPKTNLRTGLEKTIQYYRNI